MTFVPQKALFGFSVMLYDKVDNKDNFSYNKFCLEKPRFHVTITRELKPKKFSPKH